MDINQNNMFKHYLATTLLLAMSASVSATALDTAQQIQTKAHNSAAASQQRIDGSAERAMALQSEIEQLQQQVESLDVYGNHLRAVIESQNREMVSLNGQLEEIKNTRQDIVPLMYQMITGLERQIHSDMPIKQQQRLERITKLKSMMVRADISDAEKYRRIVEAYQIELNYGTKLSSYQGELVVAEQSLEADLLHLGRLSLVARSLDRSQYWAWNRQSQRWQPLDRHYANDIDHAFAVANKQVAPSLVTLPISTPVSTQQEQSND